MTSNQTATGYHVLVAVGEESQLGFLLTVGCTLAAAREGRVTILSVTTSGGRPAWLPPDLGAAPRAGDSGKPPQSQSKTLPGVCGSVPLSVVVRAGRDPGTEILTAARHDRPDLILLGWRSGIRATGGGRYLLGRTLDSVVQRAPCDVAVVRAEDGQRSLPAEPEEIERVLVPLGGGPNAALAIDMALTLSPQVRVTALNVAREVQGQVALSLSHQRLDEMLEPWAQEPRVQGKVVQSPTALKGILAEAAKGYDLVMVGASHESYLDRVLFGNIPQSVAARSPAPAIVVKRRTRRMRMGTWLRRAVWRFFGILPTLDLHEQTAVYKAIREGAQPDVNFFVMIALSAAIASFGLVQSSPAVIIGAMLVAPLMAAIFGLSLGVVRGDLRLMRRAAGATLRGILLAVAVGFVVGTALTLIAPRAVPSEEILSRTRPNLLDLGIALASGAAGAYALCRREVSASLPGVAIAAALVPPLAVIGIGLALWRTDITGGEVAGGATLLFLTNLVAITAAGSLVFLWLGFRPLPGRRARARIFQGGVLGSILLLVAVTVPLGALSAQALRQAALNEQLSRAIKSEVRTMGREDIGSLARVELDDWQVLEASDETIRLQIWVRSPWQVSHREVVELQERLANRLQRTVELRLSVIPTTNLDPFVPPTLPPTPLSGATATFIPSPTSTPTATHNATRIPTDTPTATPMPTNTATSTPTYTPTPTSTPTHTPTPAPTSTPALAEVGGTGGQGVWMYRQPGLGSGKITAWRDGTVLTVVGKPIEANGYAWIPVMDPRGRLGWIPDRYLIRLARPPR